MLYSCDFDHESLQEPVCGLKYHSGSRPGQVLYNYTNFSAYYEGWTLDKTNQWQKGMPVQNLLFGFRNNFYISISKEANRNIRNWNNAGLYLKKHLRMNVQKVQI